MPAPCGMCAAIKDSLPQLAYERRMLGLKLPTVAFCGVCDKVYIVDGVTGSSRVATAEEIAIEERACPQLAHARELARTVQRAKRRARAASSN